MNPSKTIQSKAGWRRGAALISVILAILAATSPGELPPTPLRLGMSRTMISTLAPGDAKITMDRVMAMTGLGSAEFKTTIFESDAAFLSAVENAEIDFFPIYALDVIEGRNLEFMDPVVAPARDGDDPLIRYVLLAHQGNPGTSLADFSGADFHFQKSSTRGVDTLWLDVLLGEAELPERSQFFGTDTKASSAGRAVTAVFFKKADLCLTTESEWETLAELNPQLKMQLKAIAVSKPLLTNVMCFHRSYQNGRRKTVVEEMLRMHETPAGRQLLTITRTDRMVAFRPDSLDNLVELRERHQKLVSAGQIETSPAEEPARLSVSTTIDDE